MQNLLRTKLFIPPLPFESLPRPQLVERLNLGITGKLCIVTAPAGYGKTTLITTWLHQLPKQDLDTQVVWISLDEGDNDVRRFFMYFVAALCQLDEAFEEINETFLQDARSGVATAGLVTSLVNQVIAFGQPIVLILDDYHEITEAAIHEALSIWLDNQPPNFHLVITSRSEPPLPLPRMRVRRQVTEIETDALRFSQSEAADFLNQHMRLNLSADDIAQLDSITEGWVASLQLAALSLQNKEDPTEFIQTFKGDNRYIVDYLVTEVLERQPGYVRDFLLQTSILERLNVQLCNAVTGQVGSQHILEMLDQARLFLIPLDDRRHWYRYHHLFADCLQAELQRTWPDDVSLYHERASDWFDNQGFPEEAIQHAFATGNTILAADLITRNARPMLWGQGGPKRLWQWIEQLPDDAVQTRPYLLIAKAWFYLYLFGEYGDHIDDLLSEVETLLNASDASIAASDVTEMRAEIALIHGTLDRLNGNLTQSITHFDQALTLLKSVDEPVLKTGALHSLAVTHYQTGNIAQSLKYSEAESASRTPDAPIDHTHFVSLAYRIDALRLQGQLQQAERVFHHIEPHLLQRQSAGPAMLIVSWAEVLRERNQLNQAVELLAPAIEILKQHPSMAVVVQTGAITLARIFQAQGKIQEAFDLLQETLRNFRATGTYYPSARISATEARLHLQQGNLSAAKEWVEKSRLQADNDLTYLLEIDYLVLARVLIADGSVQSAQGLLAKLEKVISDGGRLARLIEVYILQTLAQQTLGDTDAALSRLKQAIDIAQPAGFVRIFIDEGSALVQLLEQTIERGKAVGYIQQLLSVFDDRSLSPPVITTEKQARQYTVVKSETNASIRPLSPLTDRELTTLRYLATDLTIPEIAEQMVVAPSTVRTYVKRIYGKLDVHTRIEAVNRARAMALIT